ncbi:MAG: M61 family peptidase [Deltaproteobacteria bacterium]|nr:MAG: M61 family peptidase [Deltaproteobacteria bacterium]
MPAAIHYRVTPHDPAAHIFRVRLTLRDPAPEGQELTMPAWIPGSYMIRDFSKHVVAIRAFDDHGDVPLHKVDKRTWRAAPARGDLRVECDVYAWDLSVRKAHLDQTHGYFNGTSLFLCPTGREHEPCEVELDAPEDPRCAGWRVATTLPRVTGEPWSFGLFRAADYDELIDHPVEMGTFVHRRFEAGGVPHFLAVTGRHDGDLDRLCADLAVICQHHIDFWGDAAPMDRYLFQLTVVGSGYGGLEHRSSTSLIAKRDDLPRPGRDEVTDGYRSLLGLCSHEYFHTWNVKRLKPAAFTPYDLSRENHTTLLWAFEGITSYYDDLALVRTGIIDTDSYLELLGRSITRVTRLPGRKVQTLADSSFDTWIKLYQPDENSPNAGVSYYTKGAMVALALDLTIRLGTASEERPAGEKSLDDVMRDLWQRFGAVGIGVPEDGVEVTAAEVTGLDLREFFDRAIRSTEDLDLAGLLSEFGVALHLRPAEGTDDKGGKPGKEPPTGSLGAEVSGKAGAVKLRSVATGGSAMRAGLSAGDVVVAVDGLKATPQGLVERFSRAAPGDEIEVVAFRDDVLLQRTCTVQAPEPTHAWLEVIEDASPVQRARRAAWLHQEEGR